MNNDISLYNYRKIGLKALRLCFLKFEISINTLFLIRKLYKHNLSSIYMTSKHPLFGDEFVRGNYTREIRAYFENNGLNQWWISPSVKTSEIFIQPKDYKELVWEAFPDISRISIQINENGKPNFGVSGYHPMRKKLTDGTADEEEYFSFQVKHLIGKLKERGYKYHQKTKNKYGKEERGRWWLVKSLENLESIVFELKEIEPILREKV